VVFINFPVWVVGRKAGIAAALLVHRCKVSGKETMLKYVEILTVLQTGCYKLSENVL
jgi:hypothetical protein